MMVLFVSVRGQNHTDSIQRIKGFGGYRYEQSGRALNLSDIEFVVNRNSVASLLIRKANSLQLTSNIIQYSGGFLIGYSIGYGISKKYFNYSLIAVGCGLVLISIPITIASNNKLKIAVDTYNRGRSSTSQINTYDLKLGFNQNGIGLTLTL